MEQLRGKRIQQYYIDSLLQEDSSGFLLNVTDTKRQQPAALKLLHPRWRKNREMSERFETTAQTLKEIIHPGLIQIEAVERVGNFAFYTMPLPKEITLAEFAKNGNGMDTYARLIQGVEIFIQLADIVNHLHLNRFIHEGLMPDRVLIGQNAGGGISHVLLIDFGILKVLRGESTGFVNTSWMEVEELGYLAPEQLQGGAIDARTDVFTLGVLLFEYMTGQKPFPVADPEATVGKHLNQPLVNLQTVNPNVFDRLRDVMITCLALAPDDRYQSASAFGSALTWALAGQEPIEDQTLVDILTPSPTGPEVVEPSTPPRQETQPYDLNTLAEASTGWEPRLFVFDRHTQINEIHLTQSFYTVGRHRDSDIVLDSPKISDSHIQIIRSEEGWQIFDLSGKEDTYLDDRRIHSATMVRWPARTPLRIGRYRLEWRLTVPRAVVRAKRKAAPSNDYIVIEPTGADRNARPDPITVPEQEVPPIGPIANPEPGSGELVVPDGRREPTIILKPDRRLVKPGEGTIFDILIKNNGRAREIYVLALHLLPPSWVTFRPSRLEIAAGESRTAKLMFRIPADSSFQAQDYRFEIRVTTVSTQIPQSFFGQLQLDRYDAFEAEILPIRDLQQGEVIVEITNNGNYPATYTVLTPDNQDKIQFGVGSQVIIEPGYRKRVMIPLIGSDRPVIGLKRILSFGLEVTSDGGGAQTVSGEVPAKPLVPLWAAGWASLLVLLVVFSLYNFFIQQTNMELASQATATAIALALADAENAATRQIIEAEQRQVETRLAEEARIAEITIAAVSAQETAIAEDQARSEDEVEDQKATQAAESAEETRTAILDGTATRASEIVAATLTQAATVAFALGDDDGDGLSNEDEELRYNTAIDNPDTDGDGLSDGVEVNGSKTLPTNPDTDGDGLFDGEEVNEYGTNPLDEDTDRMACQMVMK